jgi:hypothetical protein
MKGEAEEAVKALKSTLHDKFKTNEILDRFPGQSLLTSSHYSQPRAKPWETSPDPELEELINEEKGVNHEGILEPGFVSLLQYQDSGLLKDDSTYGLSTQASKTSSLKKAATANRGTGSSSEPDNDSVPTEFSKGTIATGAFEISGVSWDEHIKDNAKAASSWSHSPKIEEKLKDKGFTSQDFVEWKDKNVTRIEDVFTNCPNKYQASKRMIRLMVNDRQGLRDKQAKPNPILRDMRQALISNGRSGPVTRGEAVSVVQRKRATDWRILLSNINNFPTEGSGEGKAKIDTLKSLIMKSDADIFGFTEFGKNEDEISFQNRPSTQVKGWMNKACTQVEWLKSESKSMYESGGVMMITQEKSSAHMIDKGGDKEDMGRWAWVTIKGKSNKRTTIITTYRARNYQQIAIRQLGIIRKKHCTKQPEEAWEEDLIKLIRGEKLKAV